MLLNYGLLLWGIKIENICKLQKKAIRIITNSHYIAHSEPLLKELKLLKLQDIFNLKLLKLYYNLSYTLLPPYFESYLQIINADQRIYYDLRSDARPLIRPPRVYHKFAESSLIFQLIKIINDTQKYTPDILRKIHEKSHSYFGFSFNIKQIFLETYSFECNLTYCYKCGRL